MYTLGAPTLLPNRSRPEGVRRCETPVRTLKCAFGGRNRHKIAKKSRAHTDVRAGETRVRSTLLSYRQSRDLTSLATTVVTSSTSPARRYAFAAASAYELGDTPSCAGTHIISTLPSLARTAHMASSIAPRSHVRNPSGSGTPAFPTLLHAASIDVSAGLQSLSTSTLR